MFFKSNLLLANEFLNQRDQSTRAPRLDIKRLQDLHTEQALVEKYDRVDDDGKACKSNDGDISQERGAKAYAGPRNAPECNNKKPAPFQSMWK